MTDQIASFAPSCPLHVKKFDANLLRLAVSWFLLGVITNLSIVGQLLADPPKGRYANPKKLSVLQDTQINESSGIAASHHHSGAFWTHNDSGDKPRLFLIDSKGNTLAMCGLSGAVARDWEDMCSFFKGGKSYLLVGDVGDNGSRRPSVTLYLIEEPKRYIGANGQPIRLPLVASLTFTYEDGPRDCESLAVDTSSGKIILVEKRTGTGSGVYELPLFSKTPDKTVVAKRIGTVHIPMATAMDISPDGRHLVVATYLIGFEYKRQANENWAAAMGRDPIPVVLPQRKQGEAICYDHDGGSLYLTSEGVKQPLWKIQQKMKDKLP